jgi:hypothetical protein
MMTPFEQVLARAYRCVLELAEVLEEGEAVAWEESKGSFFAFPYIKENLAALSKQLLGLQDK